MKKITKKVVSLFLTLMMVLGVTPLSGFIGTNNLFVPTAEAATFDFEVKNFKGHSYAVIDISMSWHDAVEYCEDLGGNLVTITSAEEQKFITGFLAGKAMNCYWTGGFESETDEWVWVTGEEFLYYNWKNDEPNNEGDKEDYLEIYAKTYDSIKVGQWNDIMSDGRNGKLNKSFYSSSEIGLICEWEYEEDYNKIKKLVNKCTVVVDVVDENNVSTDNAYIEFYVGRDHIKTVYVPNGKYVGVLEEFSKYPQFQIDVALHMITVRAYISLGNEMYLISDYGLPKAHLSSATTICIPSDKVQFCPELTVAYNNSNCSEKKINKLLEDTRKNYFNLTGGKVDIYFNDPRPYSSDEQIYWEDSNGDESGVPFDIRILNNSSRCNATIYGERTGGYWASGSRSYINIDTGFTYYGNKKLDSQTLCHELTHYLFGAWDEYCTGHGGLRVKRGTATNDNLYWYDDDGDGIIDNNETHASYWGSAFSKPINDFGLMDDDNGKMRLSTYDTYSYLEKEEYGGSRNLDESHPEWYTFQYMIDGESVSETVDRVLREKSGVSTYSYSTSTTDATYSADSLIPVDRRDLKVIDSTVTNETLEYVLALEQTTYPICDYAFKKNDDSTSLYLTQKDDSSITVLTVDFEDNYVSTVVNFVDGVASVSVGENIKTIYVFNGEVYNHINVNYTKTNSEISAEIAYRGENDCVFAVYKSNVDYTGSESFVGIANPFSIFAIDEVAQTGCLRQIISRNQNVDFNTIKCLYKNGVSTQETDVIINKGEHETLVCSFDYLGDGEYCLVAETAKSTVYEAVPIVSFEHVDSVYEKEITFTIDENYDCSNVFSYVLYCSESPITAESTDLVPYETFVPGCTDYTFYMFNEDFGKYYFAIQAVGIDGGKSELTIIDGIDVVEKDSDSDGIPDKWINIYSAIADLEDIPGTDSDDDGLTNLLEYQNGTNPLNPDTDGDNVYDSVELWNDLNPLEPMSDGVTDDYTIIYGTPDVSIDASSFVVGETEVTCSIENNTDGKAMRTLIYLYVGDEMVDAGTVNLDANSSVEYTFSREYLVDGMRIVLDEGQITRDTDYSNNEFAYTSATGVTTSNPEITVLKNTETQLEYILTPENVSDILMWESADERVVSVNHRGLVTAKTIGTTTVTATTPNGFSCTYNILVEPFPGAGATDFDCQLINDNTELEIIGYYGIETNITVPDSIGDYPVTSIANEAFSGCGFESIVIGAGVDKIGQSAFNGADNLKSIEVNEGNTVYASVDGVLYTADKTALIRYPSAVERTGFAVSGIVTTIEENAFNGAGTLASVDIPESVTTINSNSFANTSLTSVNFAGSQRKWDTLTIASDSGLVGVTVCYGKFTATFISEGGTINETDYIPGETIVIPDSVPEKKYYKLVDWTPEVPEAMPEYDLEFTAVFELSETTRTVEYYADGELYWYDYRYEGEEVTSPDTTPTKEGYTFVKWSPDIAETMPDENLCYKAIWDINVHQVSFIVDGEDYHSYECTYMDPLTIPDDPSKEGYTFIGWTPAIFEFMPDMDMTFTAVFNPISYTATFTSGGEVIGTDEFTVEDSSLDYPAIEEKAGYEWVWDEHEIIAGNITVNGEYVLIIYNATFMADGETIDTVQFDVENQIVSEPEIPEKAGYTAVWEEYELALADFIVNAVYTPIIYTATFIHGEETIGTDEFTVEDTVLNYPDVESKAYYKWVWDDHMIIADNITVYGDYVPVTYTVAFVASNETVSEQQVTIENCNVVFPDVPEREGYTGEWSHTDYNISLGNCTIEAIYTTITYTATFTSKGSVIGTDTFTVEDESLDYPNLVIYSYYDWVWEEHKIEARDLTIDGGYVPITYTINFVSNGKTVKTQNYTVETADTITAPNLSLPAKQHYTTAWEEWEGKVGNLTVNEIYVPVKYKLSFYCNDELIANRWYTIENNMSQILIPPTPKIAGYAVKWETFTLMYKDAKVQAICTPIEYTAQFVANGVVVSTQTFTIETESLVEPEIPPKAGLIAQWSCYKIDAKDLTVEAKYYQPEMIVVSKRTLEVGDAVRILPTCNFEVTEKNWVSSNPSVATVNQHGKVTAVAKGRCEITITCYGKDSLGNDIQASKFTKIIVNDNSENSKLSFRELFDKFFEVTLHELLYNFKEFMILLFRYAY